ncbi:hypothetical protein HGA34_03560 [Candidatus Falkowbacteria bacterium]|nr:hypothetical protein [Candidatus Falkowbacteria bacterium]
MKNNVAIISAVVILLLGGSYFYYGTSDDQPKIYDNPTGVNDQPKTEAKAFALSDVAQHATVENCWLAIEGKVYDVTKYIDGGKHPGGAAIIQGCGRDATELFNTRPMGSKTPHSDKAKSFLPNFYIGDLK